MLATLLTAAALATPIPDSGSSQPPFQGTVATPQAVSAPDPPRHPFMAANGRSNLHDDAYQSDTYQGFGPLGRGGIGVTSTFFSADCASVTFDSKGRIVTVCVGVSGPTLYLFDPHTLATLASFSLPARDPSTVNTQFFSNFAGGGYFYLDEHDRAVIPTTSRHIYVVKETGDAGFALDRDYDTSTAVPDGDGIISALPDWSGRLWFVSKNGVVGTVDPATGAVKSMDLKEPIGNSIAVGEDGGVYVVSDAAMYRFDAGADGGPSVTWREQYDNVGFAKPGQSEKGSGTTPTLMGKDLVSITDNADPMDVLVYKRAKTVSGDRLVCKQPVFDKGASDTDQSLIGTPTSMIVENNYGYSGPTAVENGKTTSPGLARVDMDPSGQGCHIVWTSNEIAPSVVPKLSLAGGLVYTYTKPGGDTEDPWYLTTLSYATGKTIFKQLAGTGLGFNNNYAPVSFGPDGTAYVGTLGGLVAFRDKDPTPALPGTASTGTAAGRPRLTLRCSVHHRVLARVRGRGVTHVVFRARGRVAKRDGHAPFTATLRRGHAHLTATVTRHGAKTVTLHRLLPACRG